MTSRTSVKSSEGIRPNSSWILASTVPHCVKELPAGLRRLHYFLRRLGLPVRHHDYIRRTDSSATSPHPLSEDWLQRRDSLSPQGHSSEDFPTSVFKHPYRLPREENPVGLYLSSRLAFRMAACCNLMSSMNVSNNHCYLIRKYINYFDIPTL